MWSLQIHALLDGYDLAGYLDDSIDIPAPTVTANDVVKVNPAFTLWKRQDKLIFSASIGAISQAILELLRSTAIHTMAAQSQLSGRFTIHGEQLASRQ